MINRASLSPCPAMARGWRLGRSNDGNGSSAGHVRVYEYSGGAWAKVGDDIDGEAADDLFGLLGLPVQRWHAGGDWGACKRRQR